MDNGSEKAGPRSRVSLWLASRALSPETVLKMRCVCAGFYRDGHSGQRSLGRALHAILDFILCKRMILRVEKRGCHRENSCLWVFALAVFVLFFWFLYFKDSSSSGGLE